MISQRTRRFGDKKGWTGEVEAARYLRFYMCRGIGRSARITVQLKSREKKRVAYSGNCAGATAGDAERDEPPGVLDCTGLVEVGVVPPLVGVTRPPPPPLGAPAAERACADDETAVGDAYE